MSIPAYRGIASYRENQEETRLFFGREQEAQEVFDLIVAEPLVVVFSRSGMGKTSLLSARVMPRLAEYGFLPVRIRVTHDLQRGPVTSTIARVEEAVRQMADVEQRKTSNELRAGDDTLWEFFFEHHYYRADRQLRPVLVFDQFEELFTLVRPQNEAEAERFVDQVADLVRRRVPAELEAILTDRLNGMAADDPARPDILKVLYEGAGPDVRVVLVMREEFLPELHTLRSNLPSVYKSSYRLQGLSLEDARECIERPAAMPDIDGGPFSFDPGVVDQIIELLRTVRRRGLVQRSDRIDPVQLQIFCHYLDQRRQKKGRDRVTMADLRKWTVSRAAEAYYLQIIGHVERYRLGWNGRGWRPGFTNWLFLNKPRASVARLCEDGLITSSGRRNSLDRDSALRRYGVEARDLERLQKERLISIEPRLDSEFIELSHDALVKPLLRRKRLRPVRRTLEVAAALLVLVFGSAAFKSVRDWSDRRATAATIAQAGISDQDRAARVRAILESGRRDLRGFQFNALPLDGFNFAGRQLQDTKWMGAKLDAADLSHSDLQRASFSGAAAPNADFASADLTSAVLAGAWLQRARFDEAVLINADLRHARVDYASFHHADVRGANFDGTAWWLGCGLDTADVNFLERRFPREAFLRSQSWRDQLRAHDRAVERETDPGARADALNNRAWLRATHGFELNQALADVNQALTLRPDVDEYHDTRGYILLQLRDYKGAAAAMHLSTDAQSSETGLPERQYHHALVLERLGRHEEARSLYRQVSNTYAPCYEALLTPTRLSLAAPAAAR